MNDDVQAIDEVVVTAIGIKQQKKKLGYTTQQVNTEALDQPGTVNVGNALSGQVAGLTVNNPTGIFQAPSFSLRGKTPLMVIDGVPVESDLFDVSPENIESINVLKGTAAAALYGSRGNLDNFHGNSPYKKPHSILRRSPGACPCYKYLATFSIHCTCLIRKYSCANSPSAQTSTRIY